MKDLLEEKCIFQQDHTIHYFKTAARPDKETILFLNGVYNNYELWLKIINNESLRDNFNLIFLNYRGFGRSSGFKTGTNLFEQVTEDVNHIYMYEKLSSLNLVGYSMGGIIAFFYTGHNPSKIKRLVVINSGFVASSYIKVITANFLKFLDRVDIPYEEYYPFLYPWYYSEKFLAKWLVLTQNRLRPAKKYFNDVQSLKSLLSGIFQIEEHKRILDKIQIPVSIILGKDDLIFPYKKQMELYNYYPLFQVNILQDSGHVSMIEDGPRVNQIINSFFGLTAF